MNNGPPVRECRGLNGGLLYTNGDGFYYAKQVKKSGNLYYVTCSTRKCRGTAKLTLSEEGDTLTTMRPHSVGCSPNFLFESSLQLRNAILTRCASEPNSLLINIFNEECNKVPEAVAACLSFHGMRSTMRNARRKSYPPTPNNFLELEERLEGRFCDDTDGTEYFYKRIGDGDTESVVFIVTPLENMFTDGKEFHMDGTFKVVPNMGNSKQLFSILVMKNDHAFPLAFALMKNKLAASYKQVLNFLTDKYPTFKPELIISDYESGIKAAVAETMPTSIHKGSWFHFSQCIFRKVQKVGMYNQYKQNDLIRKAVRMLMGLALLPQHQIQPGFVSIREFCTNNQIHANMEPILSYFENQWLNTVGCPSFSVYGHPRRTNNSQESFHHHLINAIGRAHPNTWQFTEALCSIAKTAVRDMARLNVHGAALSVNRKTKWILQDLNIQHAQQEVVLGRLTLEDFLQQMSHRVHSVPLSSVGDDIDEALFPLEAPLAIHGVPQPAHAEADVPLEQLDAPLVNAARGGRGSRGGRGRRGGRGGRGGIHGAAVDAIEEEEVDNPQNVEEEPPYVNSRNIPTVTERNLFTTNFQIGSQKGEILQRLGVNHNDLLVEEGVGSTCVICQTYKAARVVTPCGHAAFCWQCANNFVKQEVP